MSGERIVCEGLLVKRGHRFPAWRRRWCALSASARFRYSTRGVELGGRRHFMATSSANAGKKHQFFAVAPPRSVPALLHGQGVSEYMTRLPQAFSVAFRT